MESVLKKGTWLSSERYQRLHPVILLLLARLSVLNDHQIPTKKRAKENE